MLRPLERTAGEVLGRGEALVNEFEMARRTVFSTGREVPSPGRPTKPMARPFEGRGATYDERLFICLGGGPVMPYEL